MNGNWILLALNGYEFFNENDFSKKMLSEA